MTGLAQMHLRYSDMHRKEDVQRDVAYDLDYLSKRSLLLDLSILLRTVPMALGMRSLTPSHIRQTAGSSSHPLGDGRSETSG
jgi:lipopolysaccharide/colanic/teichoic acid biosynthesis glycosyltransferase